jgi:hypothetical protein
MIHQKKATFCQETYDSSPDSNKMGWASCVLSVRQLCLDVKKKTERSGARKRAYDSRRRATRPYLAVRARHRVLRSEKWPPISGMSNANGSLVAAIGPS